MERRFIQARSTTNGTSLTGIAARYGVEAEIAKQFLERIEPGAFKRALREKQDVRHLINHDPNLVLGRTKAGTTVLSEDNSGLKFTTTLPQTSYAKDLAESIKRGDID